MFRLFVRGRQVQTTVSAPMEDEPRPHICVICGGELAGDPEDELDGEGPGRDICGGCNRTRNWEAIEEVEWFSGHDS
jgi:hypothetical protein